MAVRWKVCGITDVAGGLAAVEAGADAIGFVFYPPSPRAVEPAAAATIAAVLPAETWRVGVFVDASVTTMVGAIERVGLDFVQLSGDETPEIVAGLPRHAFKALRVPGDTDAGTARRQADRYPECTLLVETAGDLYGGSGEPGNWDIAATLAQRHRLMLAGGLTPHNVSQAIRTVRPWAVDVASGVESSPGIKDAAKLREFARALESCR